MRMWASASLRLRAAAAATTAEAFSFTIMKVKDTPAKYAPATHRIRPAFTPQVWHGAGGYRGQPLRGAAAALPWSKGPAEGRALRSAEGAMTGQSQKNAVPTSPGPVWAPITGVASTT